MRKRNAKGAGSDPPGIHSGVRRALLGWRAVQCLPAEILRVWELLWLTSRSPSAEQVFPRQWLREFLRSASGIPPSVSHASCLSLSPCRVCRTVLAETLILSFWSCSSLWAGEGRRCTQSGREGWKFCGRWNCSLYVLTTFSVCKTSEPVVCNYPRLENLKSVPSLRVDRNSHFLLRRCFLTEELFRIWVWLLSWVWLPVSRWTALGSLGSSHPEQILLNKNSQFLFSKICSSDDI